MAFALGSFSAAGCPPFPAIIVDGRVVSLHAASGRALGGTRSMHALLESWEHDRPLIEEVAEALAHARTPEPGACALSVEALSVRAPAPAPRHIYCTDANYGNQVASPAGTPYFFLKAQSSVTGPYDPIRLPADATEPAWELQLAVVIGRAARHVSREQAVEHVAGYTVANDITRRELLNRGVNDGRAMGLNWLLAKCSPTFLPLGPYLVPAGCIGDPQDLRMRVSLNDEVVQEESTAGMLFGVSRLIEHLSTVVLLQPGDLILTGSGPGGGAHSGASCVRAMCSRARSSGSARSTTAVSKNDGEGEPISRDSVARGVDAARDVFQDAAQPCPAGVLVEVPVPLH